MCRKQPGICASLNLSRLPFISFALLYAPLMLSSISPCPFFSPCGLAPLPRTPAIGRLCEKCDGKCVICDSYVRPATVVRICDDCNYGSFQGKCVICGSPGTSTAYYCQECTQSEKDVRGAEWCARVCGDVASSCVCKGPPCVLERARPRGCGARLRWRLRSAAPSRPSALCEPARSCGCVNPRPPRPPPPHSATAVPRSSTSAQAGKTATVRGRVRVWGVESLWCG